MGLKGLDEPAQGSDYELQRLPPFKKYPVQGVVLPAETTEPIQGTDIPHGLVTTKNGKRVLTVFRAFTCSCSSTLAPALNAC